jgi:hypothetical protein
VRWGKRRKEERGEVSAGIMYVRPTPGRCALRIAFLEVE